MDNNEKLRASRFLSLVLRHKPEQLHLVLDRNGWANVKELLKNLKSTRYDLTFEQLKDIVDTDEKGRYAFSEDFSKIRATQGHSIDIDLGLTEKEPPDVLYHGTAYRFIDNIKKDGLKKMKRQYVHLSLDTETATNVGSRHGKAVVLIIDSKRMYSDGFKFYISDNGVWLTDNVPFEYIAFNES